MLYQVRTFLNRHKNIVSYIVLMLMAIIYSYVFTIKTMGFYASVFITMFFILSFGILLNILIQILGCTVILKIIKIKSSFKELHDKVVSLIVIRSILGICAYFLLFKYMTISKIINGIFDIVYIGMVVYYIKFRYNMSNVKTILFTMMYVIVYGVLQIIR